MKLLSRDYPILFLAGYCYIAFVGCRGDYNNVANALAPNSWQKRLDKAFLDIDGARTIEQRVRLIQRAVKDPKFSYDITKGINAVRRQGFKKGHPILIDALWPEGTIAREDIEGIQSLVQTLPERFDELRHNTSSTSATSTGGGDGGGGLFLAAVADGIQKGFVDEKERNHAVTLAQNMFRRTPKDVDILQSKQIDVVEVLTGNNTATTTIEIREFATYTAVSVELESFEDFTLTNIAKGLSRLSNYVLFEGHDNSPEDGRKQQVGMFNEMTAPFIMQNSKMWIKQPTSGTKMVDDKKGGGAASSKSIDASPGVQIEECPGGTYALLDFPGICTNAEICRRKDLLREALLLDNDHENQNYTLIENNTTTGMIVLQYNPPGTLPWRRRNQIGLPVEKVVVLAEQTEATMEEDNTLIDESNDLEASVEDDDKGTKKAEEND